MTTTTATRRHPPDVTPARGRATPTTLWLALLWALLHGSIALLHLAGRGPKPWTPIEAAVLGSLPESTGATALAVLSLVTLIGLAALAMASVRNAVGLRRTIGVALVGMGLVVALGFADMRGLALLGYLPMVLLSLAGIGPFPAAELDLGTLAQPMLSLSHTIGGLALVMTGIAALSTAPRATHRAAARPDAQPRRPAALRVGRWGVAVAVAVPLAYASTRLAWALGIPFGVRAALLAEIGDGKFAGLGLGLFAVAGSLLTLGLVQRWGEVFWRWVPGLGGRPVPVSLAVVPALVVATAVASAGLGFWRALVTGQIDRLPGSAEDWAAWAPELLWPLWGVALGAAALAYRTRRAATDATRA